MQISRFYFVTLEEKAIFPSNGGLVLIGNMQNSLAWQIGLLIPDSRKKEFQHYLLFLQIVNEKSDFY